MTVSLVDTIRDNREMGAVPRWSVRYLLRTGGRGSSAMTVLLVDTVQDKREMGAVPMWSVRHLLSTEGRGADM